MGKKAYSDSTLGHLGNLISAELGSFKSSPFESAVADDADVAEYLKYAPRRGEAREGAASANTMSADVPPSRAPETVAHRDDAKAANETAKYDFQHLAQSVQVSALALRELTRRNEAISAAAEDTIAALRNDLALERNRNIELQREVDRSKAESERLANESLRRTKEFEALVGSLNEKLEKTTAELAVAKEWLDYLNSQINSELLGAVADAEKALRRA